MQPYNTASTTNAQHHHSLLFTCPCNNLSLRITNQHNVTLHEPPNLNTSSLSSSQHSDVLSEEKSTIVECIVKSQREWKNSGYCMHDMNEVDNSHQPLIQCIVGNSLIGVESQIAQLFIQETIELSADNPSNDPSTSSTNAQHHPVQTTTTYHLYTCKNCNLHCFLHSPVNSQYYAIKDSVLLSPDHMEVPDYSRVFRVRVLPPISGETSKKDFTNVAIKEHSNRERIPKQCMELQKEMQRRLLTAKREMERRIQRFAEVERRCFERMMRRTCEVERRLLFAQILQVSDKEPQEHEIHQEEAQQERPHSEESNAPVQNAINLSINGVDMMHTHPEKAASVGTTITHPQDDVDEENAQTKTYQDLEDSFQSVESNERSNADSNDADESLDNNESIEPATTSEDQVTPVTPTHLNRTPISERKEVIRSPPAGTSPPVRRRLFMRDADDFDMDAPGSSVDDVFVSPDDAIEAPDSPTDTFLSSKETAVFELEGDEFTPLDEEDQSVKSSTESEDAPSPTNSTPPSSTTHSTFNFKPQLTSPLAKKAMMTINRGGRSLSNPPTRDVAASLPMNIAKGPSFLKRESVNPLDEYNSRYIFEQPAASYIERYSDLRDDFFGQRLRGGQEDVDLSPQHDDVFEVVPEQVSEQQQESNA
eukprot:CAMPEP_0117447226 /NCGR_PEP_ID=MMETSP0759-20121206/6761_1 /TAXON_ID=63605 /ORGANISM="Percolomonas cosmopolitus, Strain WS" /LENGTH=649 /DNA_ID=CAMNT_0005239545 /DNA_START=195 /DNA_END=2140 /DNA_ORIENTATION=-